jgi:hypothetical protein
MRTRTIDLRIPTYGSPPARYGRGLYKVGPPDAPLLALTGWTVVGRGRYYAFVSPPPGERRPNPVIPVAVPTDEEILALGLEFHARRRHAMQGREMCLLWYRPAGLVLSGPIETWKCDRNGFVKLDPQPPLIQSHSTFDVRVGTRWSVTLTWDQGDEAPPRWCRPEPARERGAE